METSFLTSSQWAGLSMEWCPHSQEYQDDAEDADEFLLCGLFG